MKASNATFLDESTGGKGKYFSARILQAGLVKYSFGVCLLEKEVIDKFIYEFVGCPVIIDHKDVTEENAKDERVGVISRVWFDQIDGWFWVEGVIFDEKAISLINDGYNVSCQYEISEYANNVTDALHNGNKYDKVILNGKPEHLAIVKNPRYENAIIAVNALELTAENEDKWITIHPNGEDGKGRHLLIKEGESVEDAMHRNGWYSKRQAKEIQKTEAKKDEKKDNNDLIEKIAEDYKDYFNEAQLKEFKKELARFEGLENIDMRSSKKTFLKMKPEDALKNLKKSNDWNENYKKEQNLKKRFYDYIEKNDFKDYRVVELTDFIGGFEQMGIDKPPTFKEIKEDGRYGFRHQLAFKYLADKAGFDNYVNDNEEDRIKAGYDKFIEIVYGKQSKKSENKQATNVIIQAINEIKETDMFKNLFKKKENSMDKDELKSLFMECLSELTASNSKEEEKEEKIEEKIEEKEEKVEDKAENSEDEEKEDEKEDVENKAKNEVVDKRDIIRQIMAIAGKHEDNEDVRTIAKLAEKLAYEKSEADKKADNKCKNEEKEEEGKKASNSILEGKMAAGNVEFVPVDYNSRKSAIELGNELF